MMMRRKEEINLTEKKNIFIQFESKVIVSERNRKVDMGRERNCL